VKVVVGSRFETTIGTDRLAGRQPHSGDTRALGRDLLDLCVQPKFTARFEEQSLDVITHRPMPPSILLSMRRPPVAIVNAKAHCTSAHGPVRRVHRQEGEHPAHDRGIAPSPEDNGR
jgi:hypothetical protein